MWIKMKSIKHINYSYDCSKFFIQYNMSYFTFVPEANEQFCLVYSFFILFLIVARTVK